MKKILCAVLLFVCVVVCGFAQQTIEYCCTHYYINGVKMKREKPIFNYITFTDNYHRFYESDEYGNATNLDNKGRPCVFKYSKTESDYNIYEIDKSLYIRRKGRFDNSNSFNPYLVDNYDTPHFQPTYKFSKDLSLYNNVPCAAIGGGIRIYKRITKAEKEAILREHEESLPKLLR